MPINDCRGRSVSVVTRIIAAAATKSTGTAGYPNVRYVRLRPGCFTRKTITAPAVRAYRIQLAKITRLKRSSYLPVNTSTEDHKPSPKMENEGVRCCGCTCPKALKKYPSRAAA